LDQYVDDEASSFGAAGGMVVFRREDGYSLIVGTGRGAEASNLTTNCRSLKGRGADGAYCTSLVRSARQPRAVHARKSSASDRPRIDRPIAGLWLKFIPLFKYYTEAVRARALPNGLGGL